MTIAVAFCFFFKVWHKNHGIWKFPRYSSEKLWLPAGFLWHQSHLAPWSNQKPNQKPNQQTTQVMDFRRNVWLSSLVSPLWCMRACLPWSASVWSSATGPYKMEGYLSASYPHNHDWGDELWGFSFTNSFLQHPRNRTNMELSRNLIFIVGFPGFQWTKPYGGCVVIFCVQKMKHQSWEQLWDGESEGHFFLFIFVTSEIGL